MTQCIDRLDFNPTLSLTYELETALNKGRIVDAIDLIRSLRADIELLRSRIPEKTKDAVEQQSNNTF